MMFVEYGTSRKKKSGPGFARFDGTETPQEIERQLREAFAPLRAMREGFARAHRWRDPETGRFVRKGSR